MKKFLLGLVFTIFAVTGFNAHAFNAYQGDTYLGLVPDLQCSTGLTCTKIGSKLRIVSSPTITTGALSIVGTEAGNATLTLSADESDDNGDDWVLASVASGNALSFLNDATGSSVSKMTLSTSGELAGYRSPVVAATATTITAAQCGSTFLSSGAVEMELPEASTVVGCTLTFVVGNASNFTIDPDAADIIVLLTNAAGDSLIADAVGETLQIRAVSASQWVTVSSPYGTWTDSN